jgi:hypothetical protein
MTEFENDIQMAAGRIARLRAIASGFTDGQAWQRADPESWCLAEVLSHLIGPEAEPALAGIARALVEDTPTLILQPADSYLTGGRLGLSPAMLLNQAADSLAAMASLGQTLSPQHRSRTVRIPWLAESPLGETPTIEQWLGGLLSAHLDDHLSQVEAIANAAGLRAVPA